ncbi:rho GTPase-activating protein 45-like isoform X2 [Zootermopsis nevadensis]|uniref:Minor histocompatibility protein HA-1 n=1 Tax=Zootermopsis nevadensis TaxID=136037 RepID=A0A067R122_ZOONE|nr:rho GTPase-activating protein 45-like isoform X2 [Zootermopsis nevadensis]KDR15612.1 Minor histocompatibility protein HA-1 [Zootermopsis nevadensis]
MDGARHSASGGVLGSVISSPRSISMASISSEGSMESPLVEQEEIAALTHDVRNFKEALGKLRKIFHPDLTDRDKPDTIRVAVHERLGEVLRILRSVLDRYPALQSTELLVTAGTLIQQVKGYNYEGKQLDHKEIFESIDQLALAFSSRVSEYLMGDLDSNISLCSSMSSKTKSCENLASDAECGGAAEDKKPGDLSPQKLDEMLLLLEQGVDFALQHAKLWSKYAKDVMMYVEKRSHVEMEYTKNLSKLAMTVRPLINEECNLPFQSIYCTALDHDMENSKSNQITCSLLLGKKFIEPLSARRVEHDKIRKQVKDLWFKEVAHMHKLVTQMQKVHGTYMKCQQEWEQLREESQKIDQSTQGKLDKRKVTNDEAMQKALEAEAVYKASVMEANEFHTHMQKMKSVILQRVRELILQSDCIIKTVTVTYFQLQHALSTPLATQFQTLCESSQLYDPGTQYAEFVKRLPTALVSLKDPAQLPFSFQPYSKGINKLLDQERKSTDSVESDDLFQGKGKFNAKCMAGSDTDSIASSQSNKSHEPSPTSNRKLIGMSSCDELNANDNDASYLGQKSCMSKAAETHAFRKLKTPSRCRECDSYVYFQGCDCTECGLACHKKCLETLAIQCGHKRLPRRMTTFGVDLGQHLTETATLVPHIVCKCIDEIDSRGRLIKGIYRVSGVKSKVEKLCQAFENGADLVDLTDIHPNVIANVLKLYLRQLPEPLLTFCLYAEFVRIAKECPSDSSAEVGVATQELKELVRKLPRHHHLTLAMLMQHLERVARDADVNNMPPSNLGIVFGPTLLRTAEGSASLNSLVDTVHQTRAIELMIANAQDIFGPQDIASAQEYACAKMGFGLTHSARKKLEPADSLEGSRDAGEEVASEDELHYFLLSDDLTGGKHVSHEAMPKVFEGSLKDYQGLEGLSLSSNQGAASASAETIEKPRKSASVEVEEKVSERRRQYYKTDGDEWTAHKSVQLSSQRTESSADSDYSFESHASSSVESRSPRELEEGCEVFLELPQWCKRNPSSATGHAETQDSPISSISHSPDDAEAGAEALSTTCAISSTSKHITGDYSTYIPTPVPSVEMQHDESTFLNYEETLLSKRTCYQAEKITMKYPGLELVPVDEKKKMVSAQVGGRATTPYSPLDTLKFSKASAVTSTTRCPPKTEPAAVGCAENVIKPGASEPCHGRSLRPRLF